mgnify:FL=1
MAVFRPQRTDSSALVDASSIDLSVMGTMMGGERGGDKQAFNGGNRGGKDDGNGGTPPARPDSDDSVETPPEHPNDGSDEDGAEAPPARPDGDGADDTTDTDTDTAGQTRPSGGNRPQGAPSVPDGDVPGTSIASTTTQNLIWYGGMLLLVLVGLSVAALYKRR